MVETLHGCATGCVEEAVAVGRQRPGIPSATFREHSQFVTLKCVVEPCFQEVSELHQASGDEERMLSHTQNSDDE